jgi:hypothetical protein
LVSSSIPAVAFCLQISQMFLDISKFILFYFITLFLFSFILFFQY